MKTGVQYLYRYDINYKSYDNDTELVLLKLRVIDETDKTYLVIDRDGYRKKRIRKTSVDAYAHTQKEKALAHLIRRTNKRIGWYRYWQEECKKAVELATAMEKSGDLL